MNDSLAPDAVPISTDRDSADEAEDEGEPDAAMSAPPFWPCWLRSRCMATR